MDVKKIGRIPDGGGWRAHGRCDGLKRPQADPVGFDYVHSLVDDHSRLAYSEIHPDEKARPAPRSSTRAADYFAAHGIARIERVMTDNAWSYTHSRRRRRLRRPRRTHKLIKPHCPWQNGKVERFNRTLQTEWAYRQVFTSNDEPPPPWHHLLDNYNHRRRHSALGGLPPISRLSPTGRVHLGEDVGVWRGDGSYCFLIARSAVWGPSAFRAAIGRFVGLPVKLVYVPSMWRPPRNTRTQAISRRCRRGPPSCRQ